MNIYLRLERPEDYRESEEVMKEAFWNHYTPGCNEHYLLHIMRDSPNFCAKTRLRCNFGRQDCGNYRISEIFYPCR